MDAVTFANSSNIRLYEYDSIIIKKSYFYNIKTNDCGGCFHIEVLIDNVYK